MWKPVHHSHVLAESDWSGAARDSLELMQGDLIEITEECSNWYRGFKVEQPNVIGILPKSSVYYEETTKTDSFSYECFRIAEEWLQLYKQKDFDKERPDLILVAVKTVFKLLRELSFIKHPNDVTNIKLRILQIIDRENNRLNLDLIPSDGPNIVNLSRSSISRLYKLHVKSLRDVESQEILGSEFRKMQPFHLFVGMESFGYQLDQDVRVYFHLCNNDSKQISERFSIDVAHNVDNSEIQQICCIFTDLGESEKENLYLVATVLLIERNLPKIRCPRRPFAAGVKKISSFNDTKGNEIEMHTLGIDETDGYLKLYQSDDKTVHKIHEMIIRKMPRRESSNYFPIVISGDSKGMHIVIKALYGDLDHVRNENAPLFDVAKETKKIGFPDIIMPGYARDDLYLSLEKAEFERHLGAQRNIEIVVNVFDSNGDIIPRCLWDSSAKNSDTTQYRSAVLLQNNMPVWNETIRLDLRELKDTFPNVHIRFEFRHCSSRELFDSKLFAFSFIRLMAPNGVFVADGTHKLHVYKCNDASKLNETPLPYERLKCSENEDFQTKNGSKMLDKTFPTSSKEHFYLGLKLISKRYTQNKDIVDILRWKDHPERVQDALQQLTVLQDGELFKFSQHILDALTIDLFSTEDGQATENTSYVFQVLVSIFSLVQSKKFENFKSVLDKYIECQFSAALIHKQLIQCCKSFAEMIITNKRNDLLSKYCDSLAYMIKLIIQSHDLYCNLVENRDFVRHSFRQDLFSLFDSLSKMMARTLRPAVFSLHKPEKWPQIEFIRSLGVILERLEGHLDTSEISTIITNLFNALTSRDFIGAKDQAIIDMVNGILFKNELLRSTILAVAIQHIPVNLSSPGKPHIWADVWNNVAHNLYQVPIKVINIVPNDQNPNWLCLEILFDLCVKLLDIKERDKETLSSLTVVLLGIMQPWNDTHFGYLFDYLVKKRELRRFSNIFEWIFKDLLKNDWQLIFSSNWTWMKLVANRILCQILNAFVKLYGSTVLEPILRYDILDKYLGMVLAYISQPCLQIEEYHYAKHCRILKRFDDMRVDVGSHLLGMWPIMDDRKFNNIPFMIDLFLQLTLIPNADLQKNALGAIYDMIQYEQSIHGSIEITVGELIQKLDSVLNMKKIDDTYREFFVTVMLEKLESDNPQWIDTGKAFIASLDRLMEIILEHRNVLKEDSNHNKRVACIGEILRFYGEFANQKELYMRYVNELHTLHFENGDYIEAGFTLKLYADELSWNEDLFTLNIVAQPEWELKVKYYQEILDYFDKGKCWEKGIPLLEDLEHFYSTKRFDIENWEQTFKLHKSFFVNILTKVRPTPYYYRVGFFGMGFPNFVRNKQFIFRGNYYERLDEFIQRLKTDFPDAQMISNAIKREALYFEKHEQFIQIIGVDPISDESLDVHSISEKSVQFYQTNDIKKFRLDLPDRKRKSWVKREILETAELLPNILRWSEIVHSTIQAVSPVEIACESIQRKINRFKVWIEMCKSPEPKLKELSMELQGTLNGLVGGGIKKYQDTLLSDEFIRSEEGKSQLVYIHRLKDLMLSLVSVLREALDLHESTGGIELNALLRKLYLEMIDKLDRSKSLLASFK